MFACMLPLWPMEAQWGRKVRETYKTKPGSWQSSCGSGEGGTTVVKEEQEETSLLEVEVQSHRPHPAGGGVPRGCAELPPARGAQRIPSLGGKLSRALFGKRHLLGWDVGSWLLPSTPIPHPKPGSDLPTAQRLGQASLCGSGPH